MRLRAVIGTLLLACVGLVALAGRGGEPLAPEAAIAQAATRTAATGSFRVSMLVTGADLRAHGSGAVDAENSRGLLTFTVDDPIGDITSEIVHDQRFLYMRTAGFAGDVPGAKPWVRMPVSEGDLDDGLFQLLGGSGHSPLPDPAAMLDFLRATSGRVEEVGSERVRDVETTHYRATVDLEQAAAHANGLRREALYRELEALRELNQRTSWPVEVWIGDDGLARRLRTEEEAEGYTDVVTIEYFDFGAAVDITLPPADEAMTFEEFVELLPDDPAGFACSDGPESDEADVMDEATESDVGVGEYCIERTQTTPDGG